MKRAACVVAGVAALLLVAGRAGAYVRYTSDAGKMFKWPQTCVPLTTYPNDMIDMMDLEEILGAVDASAAAWSRYGNACTYLDITVSSSMDATPRATNDGRNNVIFRAASWCKLTAAGACDPAFVYDPAALALTSVSASTASGVIRDADIEVNAFHFGWADLVAHPELRENGQTFHDLENAMTHEMGHLVGLDHTCYFQGAPPLDNTGSPITDCASASAEVLATTMIPSANPGDVDKRTLAADDQLAVCEIYPAATDPMTCAPSDPPEEGCSSCAVGGPRASGVGLVCGLIAAALLAARAPRRRRG